VQDVGYGRPPVAAIVLFYVAALVLSFAAAQLSAPSKVGNFPIDKGLLIGLGPLVATLLACLVFQLRLPSLLGKKPLIGVAALLAPLLAAMIAGFTKGAAAGLAGLIFGASVVLYCICEEAGWRGFLTGSLSTLKNWHADLLTGVLWFAWHFTFMPELYDPKYLVGFVAAIVAGSFGLAEARRRTGGYALAAGWHAAVKLLVFGPYAIALFVVLIGLTWASKPSK
jgi:uncharacterized protein